MWQSSTKIGVEDNVSKFNFPVSLNYKSQTSAGMAATTQNFSMQTALNVIDTLSKGRKSEGVANPSDWRNSNRQSSSPTAGGMLGVASKDANMTHSLFFESPKSESTKRRFAGGSSNHAGYPSYQGS